MDPSYFSNVQRYIGVHKLSLPSPSLCISLPIVKTNAAKLHNTIARSGAEFRAHLKTNKTTEITRIMLGNTSTKVAISTLREARGLQGLIADGTVQDVLFAIPISPSVLPCLDQLSTQVSLRVMVDHIDQVKMLTSFDKTSARPWSVCIKLDLGSKRAGLPPSSPKLRDLLKAVESSPSVELYGLYSYPARSSTPWSFDRARSVLEKHIATLKETASYRSYPSKPLVLVVGSSITARVVDSAHIDLPSHLTLEIVAGTAIYNDLQQLATNTIGLEDLAMTVVAEVCSIYEDRNEALINAGVLALTREPGSISGIARIRDSKRNGWIVERVSQEHGILVYNGEEAGSVKDTWKIGDKIELHVQHTCIVGAMYGWHFITDDDEIVRDIYFPWKWW